MRVRACAHVCAHMRIRREHHVEDFLITYIRVHFFDFLPCGTIRFCFYAQVTWQHMERLIER